MELVIDANILFAALIKDSTTSDLLFKNTLYAPEFILEEFKKYKEELITGEGVSQHLELNIINNAHGRTA
ncbi:MAG: PIN domain-containing protein [Candidatus Woesearchaeota archaeon]